MATWWKRLIYSKGIKVLLIVLLCLAGNLIGNSLIGIDNMPEEESYYETWQYRADLTIKAGFVRDWIVRYEDETIFREDYVTNEEIERYRANDTSIENNQEAIEGIIDDRIEYFKKIKKNLESMNVEYFAVNKVNGKVVTNRTDYKKRTNEEIIADFESKPHYLKGNGERVYNYMPGKEPEDYYALSSSYYYSGEGIEDALNYEVYVALKDTLEPGDSFYTQKKEMDRRLGIKDKVYEGLIVGVILVLIVGILWSIVVGQDEKGAPIKLTRIDKVPFEIHLMAYILSIVIALFSTGICLDKLLPKQWLPYGGSPFVIGTIALNLVFCLAVGSTILFIGSIIKHLKNHSLISYILTCRIIKELLKAITEKTMPFVAVGAISVYLIFNVVAIYVFTRTYGLLFSFLVLILIIWMNILVATAFIKLIMDYCKIAKGINQVASGDLQAKVELKYTLPAMKETANALNHIGDGLESAVTDALRSERFKTELITNVSHDLKTPLTSIISYIDLLKEEPIDNSTAREYIGILDERSNRLKQLVEDLVEASKAATGNVKAELMPTRIDQLVIQSVGEYTDRLEERHLNIVFNKVEEVMVPIDGRHMCRVIENLLSNVCKYAMPYTRVYIDVYNLQNKVCVVIKNISKEQLAIETEELLERFVRGESSRTTEGSGLGLAIARSLVEVQGGKLGLEVDGDLFKVVIEFPH